MATVAFSLRDARLARVKQVSDAKLEFERACEKAAAVAQRRVRNADLAWESQRGQAHKIAVLRARLTLEHQGLSSQELVIRLAIHQARLMSNYRPRLTSAQRADETWYVRMIRSQLMRRGTWYDDEMAALKSRREDRVEYGRTRIPARLAELAVERLAVRQAS